jgi:hypothetical protein
LPKAVVMLLQSLKTESMISRPRLVPLQTFFVPSHRMFGHMHGVLNVDEKQLITKIAINLRDEFFKPN